MTDTAKPDVKPDGPDGADIARTAPIAFLHIPKTAGQTIHNALAAMVGKDHVSPVRTHSQAGKGDPQMPAGYALYSGHIDWTELDSLPGDPFSFTVLRDPRERIASFYFYLLKEAEALSAEALEQKHNLGKKLILTRSAEEYFFGGPDWFDTFIRDHYDNFYTHYLAGRKMRGRKDLAALGATERLARAEANARRITRIYAVSDLPRLEADIAERYGAKISVAGTFVNRGPGPQGQSRWPQLIKRVGSDAGKAALEGFAEMDLELIDTLGLAL
ncbi:MAG: sulfotransferase family 2 domain-containing protein [Marinibacterium sp.]